MNHKAIALHLHFHPDQENGFLLLLTRYYAT